MTAPATPPAGDIEDLACPLPAPHPAVIYQPMPDGAVLFSAADEVYFGLNEAGALVWEQLASGSATIADAGAAVRARFPDADAAVVADDVAALLAALLAHGLVVAR